MLSIASLRASIGAEFKALTAEAEAEVHRFVDFIESKAQRIEDAIKLVESDGVHKVITLAEAALLPAAPTPPAPPSAPTAG